MSKEPNGCVGYYTWVQNNSGGYTIVDEEHGVGEILVIEANDAEEAEERLEEIGSKVPDFHDYCECCGVRWGCATDENTAEPEVFGHPLSNGAYVHPLKGKFYKVRGAVA